MAWDWLRPKPGRIFLIGHNKCGTRSFHKLLRKNGYSSIHYDLSLIHISEPTRPY